MKRKLDDWHTAYMRYTFDTESHPRFHKWVGLSVLAAALQKKVWFSLGRLKIHPNLYTVLVSEPGIARKSQAISWGRKLLTGVPTINVGADATTPQALLIDLEEARAETELGNLETVSHSSLSIFSKEFATFMGSKKDNIGMITFLTDIFDAEEIPFKYRTKNSGDNTIASPYLNLLAATTPSSLADQFPVGAIGGGLTSRMLFIWADRRLKSIPEPEKSPEIEQLEMDLTRDLNVISQIAGSYYWKDDKTKKFWHEWYMNYDERSSTRICSDPAFNGWYSRKPLYLNKLSILSAASRTDERYVTIQDIERAFSWMEEVELNMGETFCSVGRSDVTADVSLLIETVKKHKKITETALKAILWRDIDNKKWEPVSETALSSGKILRRFSGETAWYFWTEYVEACQGEK